MLSKMEIIFLVKVTVKEILTICVSSDSKEENGKMVRFCKKCGATLDTEKKAVKNSKKA